MRHLFDRKRLVLLFIFSLFCGGCTSEPESSPTQTPLIRLSVPNVPPSTPTTPSSTAPNVPNNESTVQSQTLTQSNRDVPKICKHKGVLEIVSNLRKVCIKGKCDLTKLLKKANMLNLTKFLALIKLNENKTTFFFRKGKVTLDPEQVQEKIESLVAQLTYMIQEPDNTIAFIIAKASKTGTTKQNQVLSTKRAESVFQIVEKALEEHAEEMSCDQIYRTYVGSRLFQFNVTDAKESGYYKDVDMKRARKFREKDVEFINQSAVVFAYPCFEEMCRYMKRKENLSCQSEGIPVSEQLPPECIAKICK
jgi:outer membrane protein OmpA-like peptidoglycan-associated protein